MRTPGIKRQFAQRLAGLCLVSLLAANSIAQPNDPYANSEGAWSQDFADQWALEQQRIYADIAPQENAEPVIVAVIDTGIDYTHPDLASEKIWHNPNEKQNGRDDDGNGFVDDLIGWNFAGHNNNPWDESGHGTHIAGVIAACTNNGLGIAAVNHDAIVMPLKVANFAGQAKSSSVAAAIYYAVDHGAAIINLSLGGELITELEKDAARYAAEKNVLLIVSAGNRGLPTEQHGYAALPHALVVGALAPDGTRAGFSNFGEDIAFLAPGVDVLSLRAKDTDFIMLSDPLDYKPGTAFVGAEDEEPQYYRASGTSFAAAVASGVASRIKSLRPEYGATELKRVMTQQALDLAPVGLDQLSGYGALDFIKALGGDPDEFSEVRLSRAELELKDKELWVKVFGIATAQGFAKASLLMRPVAGSIPVVEAEEDGKFAKRKSRERRERERKKKRKGKNKEPQPGPYDWQVLAELTESQDEALLSNLSVTNLTERAGGSVQWELQLKVDTDSGKERVAFMSLSLPGAETEGGAE